MARNKKKRPNTKDYSGKLTKEEEIELLKEEIDKLIGGEEERNKYKQLIIDANASE